MELEPDKRSIPKKPKGLKTFFGHKFPNSYLKNLHLFQSGVIPLPIFVNGVLLEHGTLICWRTVYCHSATMAELSSHYREHMAHKAYNIYRKILPSPGLNNREEIMAAI